MADRKQSIAIRGAGVVGLWQALTLARAGHDVTLYERSTEPFADACSPLCRRHARATLRGGKRGSRRQRVRADAASRCGARPIPAPWPTARSWSRCHRDRAELDRFARMTGGYRRLSPAELATFEPALGDRFAGALYYPEEAHLAPDAALRFLLDAAMAQGVAVRLGDGEMPQRRTISSSIAAGSPPRTIFPRCAACAASGSWSRAATSI